MEILYNVMKGTKLVVSLYTSFVLTEEYNVTVNSEVLTGTTEKSDVIDEVSH